MILLPGGTWAQEPVRVEVTAGVDRLHYAYRFENDSSFDTPFLVPHFFEQRYERTAAELALRARYRLRSQTLGTMLTFSPESDAFGSDFDTFFQPDGDIATSGTAGDVRLAGIGVEQTLGLVSRGAGRLDVLLAWRRDRADFLPADRIVTHTQPPSETREWTTDREITVSQTFEVGLEGGWRWQPRDSRWRLETTARLVPALRARLLVQLPDKYPGRDIVFSAAGWSVITRARVSRTVGPASIGGWLSATRAGSYRTSARFARDGLAAGVSVAYADRR